MRIIHAPYILFLQATVFSICCLSARTRLRNILDVKFNLGCHLPQCNQTDPDASAVNLFQVISSNPETPAKTNFIWSNIGGPPMVITTSSSRDSNLEIDWNAIINPTEQQQSHDSQVQRGQNETAHKLPPTPPAPITTGFHFNVTQDAAIGLLVEKIILFDDTDKSGLMTRDKPRIEIDWGQIVWDLASRTTYFKDDFLKTHLRMKPNHKYLNGSIWMKLAIPHNYKADRQKEVPHLKLNSESISIVIMVDGIQPPPSFKNTRLLMTFVVVVQSPTSEVVLDSPETESLISDEYTPGVFRIKSARFRSKPDQTAKTQEPTDQSPDLITEVDGKPLKPDAPAVPLAVNRENLGYLYWKEVAYTDRRKMISRTVDVFSTESHDTKLDTLPNISQPFYQFFKYVPPSGPRPNYNLYRFNMSFGKGDSTYSSTHLTDFSLVFGLGAAPQEPVFSLLVKAIIFVCFCLPLLVMLVGLGYLMLRRFRRTGDTELLLAADS